MRCNLKSHPIRLCQNMAVAKRGDQAQVIQSIRYKLKDQLPTPSHLCLSTMPRNKLWAASSATARAGWSKRTCFPRRCHACLYGTIAFCPVFSKNFNIMSAPFVHQPLTLSQKIDSREGLFWCKKGLHVNVGKMNIYLNKPPFAPVSGLFATKCSAFWC